jgi:class 3 adenylate cyclase
MTYLVGVLLLAALIGLVFYLRRYNAERTEVARIRAAFSRYVSPPIVDELLRRKDPRLYTGRSMHATVLVCRIRNFPGFAEQLSPEETLRYLNEFFTIGGTSIQKHRGMIDKFLSDGIIGVFGVPLEDTFQEEHALRAALDIVRLVDAMDKRWQAQGRRSIQVGIGINSGKVIAGDAGYNDRREFTVVGPETLLAARLQEATIELNAFIIASAATCDVVRDIFSLVPIKGHPLPGIKRLADACIVRGLKRLDRDELQLPPQSDFADTRVEAPPAPPPAPPPEPPPEPPQPAPSTAKATVMRESPPPPEPAPIPRVDLPDPAQPMRPRRRTTASSPSSPMDLPELRIPRYIDNEETESIMPDPPAPRATYEDDEGPPHQLPP